jgi:tetratricopeptide (TPR) repeat protein
MAVVEHGGADRVIGWLAGRDRLGTNDQLWALNGCAYAAFSQGDHDKVASYTDEAIALAAGEPYDALPNMYVFAAFDQLIDDPEAAMATVERALDIAPETPSGADHLPMIHYARARVLLHQRAFADAHAEMLVAQEHAVPRSPYRGVSTGGRLAALSAMGSDAAFGDVLASVERPARFGAQEWMYRLFDVIAAGPDEDRVAEMARAALSPHGGHPARQARDLLAVLAIVRLGRGDTASAERLALGGLSGSDFGALAFETLARVGDIDERSWPDHRRELGRSVRTVASRDHGLALVRELAQNRALSDV